MTLPDDPWAVLVQASQALNEARDNCLHFARESHKGQTRRNGHAYFEAHVEPVAKVFDCRSIERCVALLRDVAEDCYEFWYDFEEQAHAAGIPRVVIDHVKVLTKTDETYEAYIHAIAKNPVARRVKIADILNNLSDEPTAKQAQKYGRALKLLLPAGDIRGL